MSKASLSIDAIVKVVTIAAQDDKQSSGARLGLWPLMVSLGPLHAARETFSATPLDGQLPDRLVATSLTPCLKSGTGRRKQ